MNPWALAANGGAQALGRAASAAPSSAAQRASNNVSIGAPVFTTRPTSASNAANLIESLPLIGGLAVAGVVVFLVLR